jgi:hypothetical protein
MQMFRRQLRLRTLEALELRAKQFRTREDLWPLRVPREPLLLDAVIDRALAGDADRFNPLSLRSRTLLHLEWDDGSAWELWVIVLPSGLKLFCDTGEQESRVLASGGRHAGDEAARLFLERLAHSGGQDFGIEMSGGAPSRVRSSIADREFLVDTFVTLFEVTGTEGSIRQHMARQARRAGTGESVPSRDFRLDVESWLEMALHA